MQYPRGESFQLPEMSPTAERQVRLRAFAGDALTYCTMLYSRPPASAAIVSAIRTGCKELAALCSRYGQPGEDVTGTITKAEQLEELAAELTATDPRMSSYYTGPIGVALRHLVAETQAPLKARKESTA